MPLKRCQKGNKPGWKWGDRGRCYAYTPGNKQSRDQARQKALNQAVAMGELGRQSGQGRRR